MSATDAPLSVEARGARTDLADLDFFAAIVG
jgi:hypothetical protein